jgi:hypothetical protein
VVSFSSGALVAGALLLESVDSSRRAHSLLLLREMYLRGHVGFLMVRMISNVILDMMGWMKEIELDNRKAIRVIYEITGKRRVLLNILLSILSSVSLRVFFWAFF